MTEEQVQQVKGMHMSIIRSTAVRKMPLVHSNGLFNSAKQHVLFHLLLAQLTRGACWRW